MAQLRKLWTALDIEAANANDSPVVFRNGPMSVTYPLVLLMHLSITSIASLDTVPSVPSIAAASRLAAAIIPFLVLLKLIPFTLVAKLVKLVWTAVTSLFSVSNLTTYYR